ncbi:hypothetical protein TIFTF001_050224 [Ficus carica]|uniref:Uncharacterized protein n=1 Tax=Ficus carica TaxID=3494 RepID=A0AA87YUZ7_FICCA|nr:hypothetical protein TIFTF001_050224 [Ficus carica]
MEGKGEMKGLEWVLLVNEQNTCSSSHLGVLPPIGVVGHKGGLGGQVLAHQGKCLFNKQKLAYLT